MCLKSIANQLPMWNKGYFRAPAFGLNFNEHSYKKTTLLYFYSVDEAAIIEARTSCNKIRAGMGVKRKNVCMPDLGVQPYPRNLQVRLLTWKSGTKLRFKVLITCQNIGCWEFGLQMHSADWEIFMAGGVRGLSLLKELLVSGRRLDAKPNGQKAWKPSRRGSNFHSTKSAKSWIQTLWFPKGYLQVHVDCLSKGCILNLPMDKNWHVWPGAQQS